jgi:hypothetical protein
MDAGPIARGLIFSNSVTNTTVGHEKEREKIF